MYGLKPKPPYTKQCMDTAMPGKDRDDESGRYVTSYSDDDFVEVVEEYGPDVGTQTIADEVGCDRDTAYRRLRELEEQNLVSSRKVGMARLWSCLEEASSES